MKLLKFNLDPECTNSGVRNVAINPDHIVAIEAEFVSTPKDEYDCVKIIMTNGTTYFVRETLEEVTNLINA